MNKYSLIFKDKNVENQFQQKYQIPQRKLHLKVILLFLVFLQIIKIIESLMEKNQKQMYALIGYLLITLFMLISSPQTNQIQNSIICFVNVSFTIYVLFFDGKDEATNQYYKGGNHILFCIINILLTDFIESAIITMILFILRSTFFFMYSTIIDYTAFVLGLIINIGFIYIQYKYRQAQRSQYLLSQSNFQWEKILKQLMFQQEFIIVYYDEDKNSFQNLVFQASHQFQWKDNISEFLRQTQINNNQTLEQFLFQEITKFQSNFEEVINKKLYLKYQRKVIETNYSLFFGCRPTALIVIQTLSEASKNIIQSYSKVDKLLRFITQISRFIDYERIQYSKRMIYLMIQMQISYHQQKLFQQKPKVCNVKIRKAVKSLENIIRCNIIKLFDFELEIPTIPNIFQMLLLIIANCTTNHQMIFINKNYMGCHIMVIKGQFNLNYLHKQLNLNKLFLLSIVDINHLIINKHQLELKFQKEILTPYLSFCEPSDFYVALQTDTQNQY